MTSNNSNETTTTNNVGAKARLFGETADSHTVGVVRASSSVQQQNRLDQSENRSSCRREVKRQNVCEEGACYAAAKLLARRESSAAEVGGGRRSGGGQGQSSPGAGSSSNNEEKMSVGVTSGHPGEVRERARHVSQKMGAAHQQDAAAGNRDGLTVTDLWPGHWGGKFQFVVRID
jgi:hypothetical protein